MLRYSLVATLLLASAKADVYLHGLIRGSNNRNCRNDNNDERRNGNRLFDSQNNDDGGYSCPRAYPFTADNNGQSATVNMYGEISNADVDTPIYSIYGGSEIQLEWTNQHGAGTNPNMHGDVIWQYMTNENHGNPMLGNPLLRDGTPINNNDNNNANDEATTRIGNTDQNNNNQAYAQIVDNNGLNDLNDGRFGYHETIDNFKHCAHIERNKGLFTADQEMGGNRKNARYTRQDNNANRHGLECAEERDYYPYWRPSAWHDIAIITSNVSRCEEKQAPFSQNTVGKCQCVDDNADENNPASIIEANCEGTWECVEPWSAYEDCGWGGSQWACDEEPQCLLAAYSRDNHLGNQMTQQDTSKEPSDTTVNAASFTWTVPEFKETTKVVLRIRYNISTLDFDLDETDARHNDDQSPVIDRNNREELSYYDVGLAPEGASNSQVYKLSIAANSDQYARTFQDRTFVFEVKPLDPQTNGECRQKIKNLGMRGKRGNIVQAYPSVEYDFVPQDLAMTEDECLHIQWIGSDYNPNRNPNNGEGGPPNPNNDNEAKADRTNLVQIAKSGDNQPMHMDDIIAADNCFYWDNDGNCDWTKYRRSYFIDQDMSTCLTVEELKDDGINNRQARERDARNCGKLNAKSTIQGQAMSTPHFDLGLQRVKKGEYKFMSTRNNNFSNRSQKMRITVASGSSSDLSAGQIAGITIGVLALVGVLGAAAFTLNTKRKKMEIARGGGAQARPMV